MARRMPSEDEERRRKPATTPEAREQQLASMTYDLAEEQIQGGNVSSQVMTHFLKMGSTRERLEQQKMEHEIELMDVKKQALEDRARIEDLFTAAIDAMRSYSGSSSYEDDSDV